MCASPGGNVRPNPRPGPGKGYSYCEFCGAKFSSRKRYCPACLQGRPPKRRATRSRPKPENHGDIAASRSPGSVPVRDSGRGADPHGDVGATHPLPTGAAITLPASSPGTPYAGYLPAFTAPPGPMGPESHCCHAGNSPSTSMGWGAYHRPLRPSAPAHGAAYAVPSYYPWHWAPSGPRFWPVAHMGHPHFVAPPIMPPAPGWAAAGQAMQGFPRGRGVEPSSRSANSTTLSPAPLPPVASPVSPPAFAHEGEETSSSSGHASASSQQSSAVEAQALLVLAHTALEVAAQDGADPAPPPRLRASGASGGKEESHLTPAAARSTGWWQGHSSS